jgi:ATP-dependent protease ClpP protease subunit
MARKYPKSSPTRPQPGNRKQIAYPASPLFRPNPDRAIFVAGSFEPGLIRSLTPQILRLQHESRDPITVYIDSPGGIVSVQESLLRLLRLPTMDNPAACSLITVVTSLAASAAAVLLCSGDYAVAFPGSLIHFHGQRIMYREEAITKEAANEVASNLRSSNDASAVALARRRSPFFFFRFISQRGNFPAYRAKNPKAVTEKDCFIGIISEKLSAWGLEVVKKAELRYKRYQNLSDHVLQKGGALEKLIATTSATPTPEGFRKIEAVVLKAIIGFKMRKVKNPKWTFRTDGLARVNDDFFLLNEYIAHHSRTTIDSFCETWKNFILDPTERAVIEALPNEQQKKAATTEKVAGILLPIWLFFGSVCHVLQEAENPLLPEDAFWLGLIDDVVGADLPTLRKTAERQPSSTVGKNKSTRRSKKR